MLNAFHASQRQPGDVSRRDIPGNQILTDDDDDDIFSKTGASRARRKYPVGSSNSDAEIDYRKGRRLREGKGDFSWHETSDQSRQKPFLKCICRFHITYAFVVGFVC